MNIPRTLHEGGTGLGRDVHEADTSELNRWDICYAALKENAELRKSITALGDEVATVSRRCQWLTLGLFVAFAIGFLLCAALTGAGVEALK